MVAINFQAANYEPASNPDPIPAAWYTAFIVESDLKQAGATAKDPNGQYYAFVFEVCEGPYKGRKVFANYNVVNVNQQAVDIAYKDLASLYRAIGAEHENITNTEQLHNRPMEIKVGIQAARGDYDASNNIKSGGYRPVGAGATAAPSAPPPVAPPVAPPAAAPAAARAPRAHAQHAVRARDARARRAQSLAADTSAERGWLARIELAQQRHPRDTGLQYLAGKACMNRQLWGKARRPLEQTASASVLPGAARVRLGCHPAWVGSCRADRLQPLRWAQLGDRGGAGARRCGRRRRPPRARAGCGRWRAGRPAAWPALRRGGTRRRTGCPPTPGARGHGRRTSGGRARGSRSCRHRARP